MDDYKKLKKFNDSEERTIKKLNKKINGLKEQNKVYVEENQAVQKKLEEHIDLIYELRNEIKQKDFTINWLDKPSKKFQKISTTFHILLQYSETKFATHYTPKKLKPNDKSNRETPQKIPEKEISTETNLINYFASTKE